VTESEKPKLIIDEDWKSQVEKEREQLRHGGEGEDAARPTTAEAARAESAQPKSADDPALPKPDVIFLLNYFATQVMGALGQFPDPETGHAKVLPNLARFHIDTLALLQEKMQGNLSADEAAILENTLHQLRMAFVSITKLAR